MAHATYVNFVLIWFQLKINMGALQRDGTVKAMSWKNRGGLGKFLTLSYHNQPPATFHFQTLENPFNNQLDSAKLFPSYTFSIT